MPYTARSSGFRDHLAIPVLSSHKASASGFSQIGEDLAIASQGADSHQEQAIKVVSVPEDFLPKGLTASEKESLMRPDSVLSDTEGDQEMVPYGQFEYRKQQVSGTMIDSARHIDSMPVSQSSARLSQVFTTTASST